MQFKSLQPFVPSGPDFEGAKKLFQEIGFSIEWDAVDYVGFNLQNCSFILQKYNDEKFAMNFMISVQVSDVDELRNNLLAKQLPEKYKIKLGAITQQPYGRELNMIDLAGVCWHFVE